MSNVMKLRIQLRRDTSANWALYDPILLNGEAAFSSDLNQLKIGDGISKWSQLSYMGGGGLAGFLEAEVGAYPVKQADGTLRWVRPEENSVEAIRAEIEEIKADLAPRISLNLTPSIPNELGYIDIPLATANKCGLVLSSNEENKISVLADGTMEVNAVNINKLTQTDGEELILKG